ncbi:MAG: tRNA uridine-5-carboxymethylaminomethyl(34) synthesis GTPase MnmE [Deltaproteobacteria bacterium]|nr:tRNA uridine-5-carboxymethylaminomethyl(34) synthesis GTPase MnmE [Deltaproteobacteria bacterium]
MKLCESFEDTIAAIATPIGAGGIGIIKISGPEAWAIGRRLFDQSGSLETIQSHHLYHGHIVDSKTEKTVDEVLVSFMRAPSTYTREDVVEINCHSGFAVLDRILGLVTRAGARLAEPGEFTRRAFLNGRLDLTQAEAVLDLIHSKTRRSLDLASEHLRGGLQTIITELRGHLLDILAMLEAAIDFPDEDLEILASEHLAARFRQQVQDPITQLLEHYEDGRILREGLAVIIAGKPNVGKSSLLNKLLRSNRALVTPVPGTTRDVIEESFSLRGIPLRLMDTAGLRQSEELVEKLGMEFTRERLAQADLVLFLLDRSTPLAPEDLQIYRDIGNKPRLLVLNKVDLEAHPDFAAIRDRFPEETMVETSALYGDGMEELKDAVFLSILGGRLDTETSVVAPNLRHKLCLERSLEAVNRGLELLDDQSSPELIAFEVQEALAHLGEIVGLTTTEDLLDQMPWKIRWTKTDSPVCFCRRLRR